MIRRIARRAGRTVGRLTNGASGRPLAALTDSDAVYVAVAVVCAVVGVGSVFLPALVPWWLVAAAGVTVGLAITVESVTMPLIAPIWLTAAVATLVDLRPGLILLALLAAVVGGRTLWRSRTDDETRVYRPAHPPETALEDENRTAGSDLDGMIVGLTESGDEWSRWRRMRARRKIRDKLREVAVPVVASAENCSRERATALVDAGTWTDRDRAAAFLGGDEGPTLSPWVRLRDWASGNATERSVEATIESLRARIDGDAPTIDEAIEDDTLGGSSVRDIGKTRDSDDTRSVRRADAAHEAAEVTR